MRRRKRYEPLPDDGLVNYGDCLVEPELVQRNARFSIDYEPQLTWDKDPSYFWAEQKRGADAKRRKNP